MAEVTNNEPATLVSLRGYLSRQDISLNSRLPPERELCRELGASRTALRKALAVLEAEGQIWRHVGRGTFIGARPVLNLGDIEYLAGQTNPACATGAAGRPVNGGSMKPGITSSIAPLPPPPTTRCWSVFSTR
jgi:DNA-binding transcriptional MocR family regulator